MNSLQKTGTFDTDRKQVLIVDDNKSLLEAIALIIEDAGYKATTVSDGSQLLKLQRNLPNLIILDIFLSGQDGRLLCRHLKSQVKTKNIPIVMSSAHPDIQQFSKEAGADAYLPKPFEINALLNLVKRYISSQ